MVFGFNGHSCPAVPPDGVLHAFCRTTTLVDQDRVEGLLGAGGVVTVRLGRAFICLLSSRRPNPGSFMSSDPRLLSSALS